MTKIWVQDYLPLSKTEEGLLGGLVYSPVAFGSYISDNIFGYSGGKLLLFDFSFGISFERSIIT